MRSRMLVPQRSNLTTAQLAESSEEQTDRSQCASDCGSESLISVWCYFLGLFHIDSTMCPSLICSHDRQRPQGETWWYRGDEETCMHTLTKCSPRSFFNFPASMHNVYSSHKLLCKITLSSSATFSDFNAAPWQLMSLIGVQLVTPADVSVSPGYRETHVNMLIFKFLSCKEAFILACVH